MDVVYKGIDSFVTVYWCVVSAGVPMCSSKEIKHAACHPKVSRCRSVSWCGGDGSVNVANSDERREIGSDEDVPYMCTKRATKRQRVHYKHPQTLFYNFSFLS